MVDVTSPAQSGQYVQANGLKIYYEEYGSGEPLLLIHGAGYSHSMWAPQIPIFAQHYRVIAPDSRGHGRTTNPLDRMSYRMLADDMDAFIQALGLAPPLVCGHSDGGQVALEMAIHYPSLAKAYVVTGAMYKWTDTYLSAMGSIGMKDPGVVDLEQAATHDFFIRRLQEHQDAFQGDGYWQEYLRQLSYMFLTPWHHSDEELGRIDAATLILTGDSDETFMPVEQAVHMYHLLPNAQLAIVPGTGHSLYREKPELVLALVLDFLLRQSKDEGKA